MATRARKARLSLKPSLVKCDWRHNASPILHRLEKRAIYLGMKLALFTDVYRRVKSIDLY